MMSRILWCQKMAATYHLGAMRRRVSDYTRVYFQQRAAQYAREARKLQGIE